MKTLIFPFVLISTVIAVPAVLENGFKEIESTQNDIPETIIREKKAPVILSDSDKVFMDSSSLSGFQESPFDERSHLLIKKPIIIKKKIGYHVYRDSDEEQRQADPKEKCREHVKVKLCENDITNNHNMRQNLEADENHTKMSKVEMEQSIKMAKEAVKNLQKDLQRIEKKSNEGDFIKDNISDTEPEREMHEDIEIARQVLEHMHSNFGKLKSLSLHATKVNDENFNHSELSTLDKDRMAQWMKTMENIQRPIHGKNIEDRFNSEVSGNEESTDATLKMAQKDKLIKNSEISKSENTSDTNTCKTFFDESENKNSEKWESEDMKMSPSQDIISETKLESGNLKLEENSRERSNNILPESVSSQTETVELNTKKEIDDSVKSIAHNKVRMEMEENETNFDKNEKELSNELSQTSPHGKHLMFSKSSSNNMPQSQQNSNGIMTEDNDFKQTTNKNIDKGTLLRIHPQNTVREFGSDFMQKNNVDDHHSNILNHHVREPFIQDSSRVSSMHKMNLMETPMGRDTKNTHQVPLMENDHSHILNQHSHGQMNAQWAQEDSMQTSRHINIADKRKEETLKQSFITDNTQLTKNTVNNFEIKTDGHSSRMDQDSNFQNPLKETANIHWKQEKASDDHNLVTSKIDSTNLLSRPINFPQRNGLNSDALRVQEENRNNQQSELQKMIRGDTLLKHEDTFTDQSHHIQSLKETPTQRFKAHIETAQLRNDMQYYGRLAPTNNMEHSNLLKSGMELDHGQEMQTGNHRLHDTPRNTIFKSQLSDVNDKAFDIDSAVQASEHVLMRDTMHNLGANYNQQWFNNRGLARGYMPQQSNMPISTGTGTTGTGTVGLFPNAHASNCAIPLLLSCSPSVVSGSLAQSHTPYTAPSYRFSDDLKFHNKRNVKKADEKTVIKSKNTIKDIPSNNNSATNE